MTTLPNVTSGATAFWFEFEPMTYTPPRSFAGLALADSNEPTDIIGIGDSLAVSILSPGSTLFASGDNNSALPPLVVDRNGAISVPYAGSINVQGMTPGQAATAIRRALTGKVGNPQVVVSQATAASNSVTVLGDVRSPGRQALNANHDRLLDFSRAATGTLFFVPSATFLDNVEPDAAPPSDDSQEATVTEPADNPPARAPASDGSLGIGSLKEEAGHE